MAVLDPSDFLEQPFRTWQSAVVYLLLWGCLAWALYYVGGKYAELLPTTPPVTRPLGPYPSRTPPSPLSAFSRSARSQKPRSPLYQVTSTSSTSSTVDSEADDREATAKRSMPAWLLAPPHVTIGQVSQGTIARRRSDRALPEGTD